MLYEVITLFHHHLQGRSGKKMAVFDAHYSGLQCLLRQLVVDLQLLGGVPVGQIGHRPYVGDLAPLAESYNFV